MLALYEQANKIEYAEKRFEAGVHGVSLDGKGAEKKKEEAFFGDDEPIFKEPSEYKSKSKEELDDLTEKMMKKLKPLVGSRILGKKK